MREPPVPIPRLGSSPPQQRAHHPQDEHRGPTPQQFNDDSALAPLPEERHLHRIAVETGPEPVFVTIGRHDIPSDRQAGQPARDPVALDASAGASGHPTVPGGFAKFFNRVIDTGGWARLPEAARAVYMPMVRFADGRDGFRVRIGLASLMRHTRLSRSSVKRGLRALAEARLLAVVRAGGVAPDGTNRTNVYQLLLPEPDDDGAGVAPAPQSAARAKRGPRATARAMEVAESLPTPEGPPISTPLPELVLSLDSWSEPTVGPPANPLPAQSRSPAPRIAEPPANPPAVPADGRPANPGGGPPAARAGAADELLQRSIQSYDNSEEADVEVEDVAEMLPERDCLATPSEPRRRQLIGLLRTWGVGCDVASDIADHHSPEQILSAVALARRAKGRGRLRNPAGYIVRCLGESWTLPVESSRSTQPAPASSDTREQAARRDEEQRALAAREAADARLDELDDETLGLLAERVLRLHAGRPAMLRLLRARPPRECRLMRAEIAALGGLV